MKNKIPEIKLEITTKKVPDDDRYTIEDIVKLFGNRIKKAIVEEKNKNNHIYCGLKSKEMSKICKRWKFWNRDIRRAWKKYFGNIFVPYVIVNKPPVVVFDPHCEDVINKMIKAEFYERIERKRGFKRIY